jgi:hypothetical protein
LLLYPEQALHSAYRYVNHFDADPGPDPACHFVADPVTTFHFDADPDPTFHFDTDPDPNCQFDPDTDQ